MSHRPRRDTVSNRLSAGRGWRRAGLFVLLASSFSCGDAAQQGRAPVSLVIDSLAGASGAAADEFGNVLQSDVLTGGGFFEDPGRVQMRILLKDLGVPGITVGPSLLNQVTITRYRVVFRRSDGRETPGVDVPHPFDGGVTATVTDSGVTFDFTLVRVQAKLEPPLKALQNLGGAIVISTLAEVTFFGKDQAGNDVSGTGVIDVHFADWADPEGTDEDGNNGEEP